MFYGTLTQFKTALHTSHEQPCLFAEHPFLLESPVLAIFLQLLMTLIFSLPFLHSYCAGPAARAAADATAFGTSHLCVLYSVIELSTNLDCSLQIILLLIHYPSLSSLKTLSFSLSLALQQLTTPIFELRSLLPPHPLCAYFLSRTCSPWISNSNSSRIRYHLLWICVHTSFGESVLLVYSAHVCCVLVSATPGCMC